MEPRLNNIEENNRKEANINSASAVQAIKRDLLEVEQPLSRLL